MSIEKPFEDFLQETTRIAQLNSNFTNPTLKLRIDFLFDNFLSSDGWLQSQVIQCPEFFDLFSMLLRVVIANLESLTDDNLSLFGNLLRQCMVKTSHRFYKQIVDLLFKFFKRQVFEDHFSPKNDTVVDWLATTVPSHTVTPPTSYFFLSTKPGEYLEVDLSLFSQPAEPFQNVSLFAVFQTDFELFGAATNLVSSLNVTDATSVRVRADARQLWFEVSHNGKTASQTPAFDAPLELSKHGWHFFSFALRASHAGFVVSLSLNGLFFEREVALSKNDRFAHRHKFTLFESCSLCLNALCVAKEFFGRQTVERFRSAGFGQGIGDRVTLSRFYAESGLQEFHLLTGLSLTKFKSSIFHFRDRHLVRNMSFIGYLVKVESGQALLDCRLAGSRLLQRGGLLCCLLPQKDSAFRLVLRAIKAMAFESVALQRDRRDRLLLVRMVVHCLSDARVSATALRQVVHLVEGQSTPDRAELLNGVVLSHLAFRSLLASAEATGEYLQALMMLFDHDWELCALVDYDALQETLLRLLLSEDQLRGTKASGLCKLAQLALHHHPQSIRLTSLPLFSLLSNPVLSFNDHLLAVFELAVLLLHKLSPPPSDDINFGLVNLLVHTTDPNLVHKALQALHEFNPNRLELVVFAWRLKHVRGRSVLNVVECYEKLAGVPANEQSCDQLAAFVEGLCLDKAGVAKAFSEVPQLVNGRLTTLLCEVSTMYPAEQFKQVLLTLTLSVSSDPPLFVQRVNPCQFSLWLFSCVAKSRHSQSDRPTLDLLCKLLSSFVAEAVRQSPFNFHPLFVNSFRLGVVRGQPDLADETLGLVFKHLTDKRVLSDRDHHFNTFVALLLLHVGQTMNSVDRRDKALQKWAAVMAHLELWLTECPPRVIAELTKPIWSVLPSTLFDKLIVRMGLSDKQFECNSTALHFLKLVLFRLSEWVCAADQTEHSVGCVATVQVAVSRVADWVAKHRQSVGVEQAIAAEAFLVDMALFVGSFGPMQSVSDSVCGALASHPSVVRRVVALASPHPIGHDAEGSVSDDSLASLRNALRRLGVWNESDWSGDWRRCLFEAENMVVQSNDLPKFDGDFEERVSQCYSTHASQREDHLRAHEDRLETVRVDSVFERHMLEHQGKKFRERHFQLGGLMFPKQMERQVYRTVVGGHMDFDKDLTGRLQFKHRSVATRELQRPFVKVSFAPHPKAACAPATDCPLTLDRYFSTKGVVAFKAIRVNRFSFVGGYLFVDEPSGQLSFAVCPSVHKRRNNPVELVEYVAKAHHRLLHQWPLESVGAVHEFRFLQKRQAVEVIMTSSKSLLFHFLAKADLQSFLKGFMRLLPQSVPRQTDPVQLFRAGGYQLRWEGHGMSNFEYLMRVNRHSCRSTSDFSQYPVFPVLVKSIDSEELELRNLECPIGMVGDPKRKASFMTRFAQSGSFHKGQNYHYGSHYSSPAIALSFLIRLRPYQRGCLAIQSGVFDLADRLFFNFASTIRNVMCDISDVREFVPEFFYLPAVLLNLNHFDFGKNQNNVRVHDVLVPDIFMRNPYRLVFGMRRLLEMPKVSQGLGRWIDLVFGYRQSGDRARKANNVFFHLTYEPTAKQSQSTAEDPNSDAVENQIYHFGQVPVQLFHSKHSPKNDPTVVKTLINDRNNCAFGVLKSAGSKSSADKVTFVKVMKDTEEERDWLVFNAKLGEVVVYRFSGLPFATDQARQYSIRLDGVFSIVVVKEQLNAYLPDHRVHSVVEVLPGFKLLFGGLLTGHLVLFALKGQKRLAVWHLHDATVTQLLMAGKRRLVSVDQMSIVVVSAIDCNANTLTPTAVLHDFHTSPLRTLNSCPGHTDFVCLFSSKGVFEVRDLRVPDLVLFSLPFHCAFKGRKPPLTKSRFDHCVLSFGYVGCLVVCSYHAGISEVVSFSFEGRVIGRYSMRDRDAKFVQLFVLKNELFADFLFAVGENGENYMFDLPMLDKAHRTVPTDSFKVKRSAVVAKNRMLWTTNDRGVVSVFGP